MHVTYTFNFLETVSRQLKETLDAINASQLTILGLQKLWQYQNELEAQQGVYVLYYEEAPVYLGKAYDLADRLSQHYIKLTGRKFINLENVGYKALLLDKSMSTAANEEILIAMFRTANPEMWNGKGFGPKDPGKERDTTKPSWFDLNFPIIDRFPVQVNTTILDEIELCVLLGQIKVQLPYVFRYSVPSVDLKRFISLSGIERDARSLTQAIVNFLGIGWKGVVISYGIVIYRTTKEYTHGVELLPALVGN